MILAINRWNDNFYY